MGKWMKKFNILKEISETSQSNQAINNYHIIEYYYTEGHILKMEQFKMNDKNKFTYTMETEDGTITETTYSHKINDNEYIGTTYIENGDNKTVRENEKINRVQIIFDDVPDEKIRDILKSRGFKWSRYEKAWQRLYNMNSIKAAKGAIKDIKELNNN